MEYTYLYCESRPLQAKEIPQHDQRNFRLKVKEGEFADSQIIVMLGEEGTGKSTFMRMLVGLLKPDDTQVSDIETPGFNVSYKRQNIIPKFPNSVRHLLHKKIGDSYMHPQFVSDILRPLQIEKLMDQEVDNLSRGELQRLCISSVPWKAEYNCVTKN